MRALHVVSGRLFGGIEQMLVTIARCRHVTPAMDVQFAVAAPGRLEQELRANGVDVVTLGDVRLSRPATVVHARARFAQVLASAPSSTVAVCHAPWAFALFAPVARRKGIPVVLWQHDHASGRSLVERWARTTPADLVICNSSWTSKTAAALQPNAIVRVIHPPVSLPLPSAGRQQIRAGLDAASDSVIILSASRLEPWKGHLHLLRALGQLTDVPRWTLWIAGGAQRPHELEYLQQLRGEVARLGIESRVRFLGERRDVAALLRGSDVFCQANDGPEPFGVVFAEALLSGVPVVTVSLGGAPEIVSDTCGRIVPAGDLNSLARVLRDVVTDEGLRRKLGTNGPAHATARVAPDVVLPQLARALEALTVSAAA